MAEMAGNVHWGKDYRAFRLMRDNADYKEYMTYLNYAPEIQSMIYTTNWIERLNRDFRRVTRDGDGHAR